MLRYCLTPFEAPLRPGYLTGSLGVFAPQAPAGWLDPWLKAGAERLTAARDPTMLTHVLVAHPDLSTALDLAQARAQVRGTTWVLTAPSPEGAAAGAILRAAAVEGQQEVRVAQMPRWLAPAGVAAWTATQPGPFQGPGGPAFRLEPQAAASGAGRPCRVLVGPGPLGRHLAGGSGPDVQVVDAPDRPLRDCSASDLDLASLQRALDRNVPIVLAADDLTRRPGGLPSAVLAAAGAWALARGDQPWCRVGPVGPGARRLGIAGLDPEQLRPHLLDSRGDVWLDVDWDEALAAFPHMRELAGHLLDHPRLRRGRVGREVLQEAQRLLGSNRLAADLPLSDQGADSLVAEELRQALVVRYHVDLPLTLLLDCPTVHEIADRIVAMGPA